MLSAKMAAILSRGGWVKKAPYGAIQGTSLLSIFVKVFWFNNDTALYLEWRQNSFYSFILIVNEVMDIYLGCSYWIVFSG